MKQIHILIFIIISSISLNAQCYPDRHSTNWFDAWVSCEVAPNPNPVRRASHWIMYDLGISYKLGTSHIWNINDPKQLKNGVKKIVVDYSNDGINWTSMDTFDVEQASGRSIYEGVEGPNFEDEIGRYVLFTATENYGGDCTGFSEIKINVDRVSTSVLDDEIATNCLNILISPNPFWDNSRIALQSTCLGDINYEIYDMLGKPVMKGSGLASNEKQIIEINGSGLESGAYVIRFIQGDHIVSKSFFKLKDYR